MEGSFNLARKDDNSVKRAAAQFLVSAYCQVQNTNQAWHDLHELTTSNDVVILKAIAFDLGASFNKVLYKWTCGTRRGWLDLCLES